MKPVAKYSVKADAEQYKKILKEAGYKVKLKKKGKSFYLYSDGIVIYEIKQIKKDK